MVHGIMYRTKVKQTVPCKRYKMVHGLMYRRRRNYSIVHACHLKDIKWHMLSYIKGKNYKPWHKKDVKWPLVSI